MSKNDFKLQLAQELLDQVESESQYNKILALVTTPRAIIEIENNQYLVRSLNNWYKPYTVYFSIRKGWICQCKFYTIDLKQTKSCSHIIACRIYQIIHG